LQIGSASLRFERNQFDEIPDSHIDRSETEELFNWLIAEAPKDKSGKDENICLLAGNAGMGKTIILKDLYDKLAEIDIPVLGLKTDKLYAGDLHDLQHKLGFSIPVFKFIEQCKENYDKTVLIIDQIDALSQSMSTDRNYLTVIRSLIDHYTHDTNVRIIVSVRIFDLHYDPSLRVYKNIKTVKVDLLKDEAVLEQLKKLNITSEMISTKLLQLIRTPNHLNVFSRIAKAGNLNAGITSVQGLYTALWKQKIITVPSQSVITGKKLKELLYKIANNMFKYQRISVSEHHFEDHIKELSYLESELLVKKDGNQLQFFHQSFYDYVFAKRFVERKENLLKHIKEQEQSIHIRSGVKMIINYLRDFDPVLYLKTLEKIVNDAGIYFHLKHMLISMMAFIDHPTEAEATFIVTLISKSITFNTLFLEHANSKEWLEVILRNNLLDQLKNADGAKTLSFSDVDADETKALQNAQYNRNLCVNFLREQIVQDNEQAWDFLLTLNDPAVIKSVLYDVKNWENKKAFTAFEKCGDFSEEENYIYQHILSNVVMQFPEFAFDQIKATLLTEDHDNKTSNNDYEEETLFKELTKSIPEKLIATLFEIIERNLDSTEFPDEIIISDYKFNRVDLRDSENLSGREYIYRLLAICLRRAAAKQAREFTDFLEQHRSSRIKAILRLIVFAIGSNEKLYANEIFELFNHLHRSNYLKKGKDFSVEYRAILKEGFPYFSDQQQKTVVHVIKHLVVKREAYVFQFFDDKRSHLSFKWGESKYAFYLKLPAEVIEKDNVIRLEMQELKRKYPNFKDKSTLGPVLAGIVRRPLNEKAYQFMGKKQWINSFKKYSKERNGFEHEDFLKGGLREHSGAFEQAVKKDPGAIKVEIIEAIIDDPDINITYAIRGIYGLTEADPEVDPTLVLALFKRLLRRGDLETEYSFCISIAKYTLRNDCNDGEVINFLVKASLDLREKVRVEPPEKETSINGLVTRGINTPYGSAACGLVYINDVTFEDLVFETLTEILTNGRPEARAVIYWRFAYLMSFDGPRAFDLFVNKLTAEKDIAVIASSIWSLQYLGNYDFKQLKPIYEKLISSDKLGREDSQNVFSILYFSYLFDKPEAGRLLFSFLENNKHAPSWAMHETTKHFYFNEVSQQKSLEILMFLVNKTKQDEEERNEMRLLKFDHIRIADIAEFLEKYVLSPQFVISQKLISYLTNQCNQDTFKCIELFNQALLHSNIKENHHFLRTDDDITKFIVSAFNSLKGNDSESKKQRIKLLESFDLVLKDFRFRRGTNRILDELI
jgi:hypothetical protein